MLTANNCGASEGFLIGFQPNLCFVIGDEDCRVVLAEVEHVKCSILDTRFLYHASRLRLSDILKLLCSGGQVARLDSADLSPQRF